MITHRSVRRLAPQNCLEVPLLDVVSIAIQGHECGLASSPPTILEYFGATSGTPHSIGLVIVGLVVDVVVFVVVKQRGGASVSASESGFHLYKPPRNRLSTGNENCYPDVDHSHTTILQHKKPRLGLKAVDNRVISSLSVNQSPETHTLTSRYFGYHKPVQHNITRKRSKHI